MSAAAMTKEQAVEKLAEMLNKGEIDPVELIGSINKKAEVVEEKSAEEKPAEEVVEKSDESAPAAEEVKKFEGEEVYDAAAALSALSTIMNLIYSENSESEENAEQMAQLKAAVDALKAFIASEIQEDNSADPDADADMDMVEMGEATGDIAKAGKEISASNMKKIQAMHDHAASMGAKCSKADAVQDVARADTEQDIANGDFGDLLKAELAKELSKADEKHAGEIAKFEDAISKMSTQLEKMAERMKELEEMPVPAKGALMSVSKGDDTGSASKAEDDPTDAMSDIKKIHQSGGLRFR